MYRIIHQFSRSGILIGLLMFVVLIASTTSAYADSPNLRLSIPSIHVETSIGTAYLRQFANGAVTWDMSPFRWRVAHLQGTAWFGQPGNTIIGGHAEANRGEPDIFYYLELVSVGDEIIIHQGDDEQHYQIVEIKNVDYKDLSVLFPIYSEQLTLITCNTHSYDEDGDYARRVVVIAVPVSG